MPPSGILRKDAWSALREIRRWSFVAWLQTKRQYMGTVLGAFWITIANLVFCFGVALLYSSVLGDSFFSYFPYLCLGYTTWLLISEIVILCGDFINKERGLLHQIQFNLTALGCKHILIRLFVYLHNFPIVILAIILAGTPLLLIPLSMLGLLFVIVNGWIFAIGASILAARFKDVPIILQTTLRLMFFLTPIIWRVDTVTGSVRKAFVDFNPFYYLLEIVRAPLLGNIPEPRIYMVCLALMICNITLTTFIYNRYHRYVTYWI